MPGIYVLLMLLGAAGVQQPEIVLATTTSTRDTGLLDSLLPLFGSRAGYKVKVIAVGTGQALEMGRRGDADVVLVHAPAAERVLVDSGYFVRRRLMMHNDLLIVGPAEDPARVRGMSDAVGAMRAIAARAPWVSRGDRSGTHIKEQELWRLAGIAAPAPGGWIIESGQGMAATLQMADQKKAYTLTDRATLLAWREKLQLEPLVEGDSLFYNVYHVMETRSARPGARAPADFFVSAAAQELIGRFGVERFGRQLFVPDAGKPDRW